jgi:hypothetical protein
MVFLKNISIDTLHKGATEDDDDDDGNINNPGKYGIKEKQKTTARGTAHILQDMKV